MPRHTSQAHVTGSNQLDITSCTSSGERNSQAKPTLGDSREEKEGMRCLGMVRLLGMEPTAEGQGGRQPSSGGERLINGGMFGLSGMGPTAIAAGVARVHAMRGTPRYAWLGAKVHAAGCAPWVPLSLLPTWQRSAARLQRVQQVSREGADLDLGEGSQLCWVGWKAGHQELVRRSQRKGGEGECAP